MNTTVECDQLQSNTSILQKKCVFIMHQTGMETFVIFQAKKEDDIHTD